MSELRPDILIVDDQADVLATLRLTLRAEGYSTHEAHSPEEALERVGRRRYDLAIVDMNYARETTSGAEGLALIEALRGADETMPIVAVTAFGNVPLVVEAMRRGAANFIEKPWQAETLVEVVGGLLQQQAGRHAQQVLAAQNRPQAEGFVARSAAMQEVLDVGTRVADADVSILLTGENGTGKSQFARTLHARSKRGDAPFVEVNTGAIPASLFESEMFGHTAGAFTDARGERLGRFEMARGGTIFLDEIGNLTPDQQSRLLQVLDTGEFQRLGSSVSQRSQARVIAATNADLGARVKEGSFREDLLYRLNTVHIHLPPLRERREDILPLAELFLARLNARHGRQCDLTQAAQAQLRARAWPGNVRELSHVLERAVLLAAADTIDEADVGAAEGRSAPSSGLTLADIEQEAVARAVQRHQGNLSAAARELGISRGALYRKLPPDER